MFGADQSQDWLPDREISLGNFFCGAMGTASNEGQSEVHAVLPRTGFCLRAERKRI